MRIFVTALTFVSLLAVGCGGTADPTSPDLEATSIGAMDLAGPGDPALDCEGGLAQCKSQCVSLADDEENCGECGRSCANRPHAKSKGVCSAGTCEITCATGWADCNHDATDGCEADLSSAQSCHACGALCSGATPICGASSCEDSCGGGTPTLCGTSCRDLETDPSHCGACDVACPAPANGAATCTLGSCGTTCVDGYVACTAGCCASWTVAEFPAIGGGFTKGAQFVLDAGGKYHVVFSSQSVDRLSSSDTVDEIVYAVGDSSGFTLERIERAPDAKGMRVTGLALARRSDGSIHVAYRKSFPVYALNTTFEGPARYARRDASGWVHQDIPSDGEVQGIALGAADQVHVLLREGNEELVATGSAGAGFTTEALGSNYSQSQDAWLATDSTGTLFVALSQKLGQRGVSGWTWQDLPSWVGPISFDGSGRLYIAGWQKTMRTTSGLWELLDPVAGPIRFDGTNTPYATRNGKVVKLTTTWQEIGVAAEKLFGLQLAADGTARTLVRLATHWGDPLPLVIGTSQSNLVVDSPRRAGKWAHVATDGMGIMHLVYVDDLTSQLHHAENTGADWTERHTIDGVYGDSGTAAGSDGTWACVSTATELRLVHLSGATVSSETITKATQLGTCRIVLDASEQPHVVYRLGTQLVYARKSSSTWDTTVVTSTATAWMAFDVTLNPAGNPEILFGESKVWLARWETDHFVELAITSSYAPSGGGFVYDANGIAHLLLRSGERIWYARLASNVVTTELIGEATSTTGTLRLTPTGPEIVFAEANGMRRLGVATKTAGAWQIDYVAKVPEIGKQAPSVTLSSSGERLVALYEEALGRLVLVGQP